MDDRDACDGYGRSEKSCYLPLHLYDMFDQTTFACENTYILAACALSNSSFLKIRNTVEPLLWVTVMITQNVTLSLS